MTDHDLFDNTPCLALKPGSMQAMILEMLHNQPHQFLRQLEEKIAQAPQMFVDTGIILSLEKLTEAEGHVDLKSIIHMIEQQRVHVLGVCCLRPEDLEQVHQLGLLHWPASRLMNRRPSAEPVAPPPSNRPSVFISQPVRGGQQVYAAGADLIVTASVSAGAELIADGNIHVYAPLRGRALAGVQGNSQARIFCRHLDAELIAIAGNYMIAEAMRQHPLSQQSVQVYLLDTQLHIEPL